MPEKSGLPSGVRGISAAFPDVGDQARKHVANRSTIPRPAHREACGTPAATRERVAITISCRRCRTTPARTSLLGVVHYADIEAATIRQRDPRRICDGLPALRAKSLHHNLGADGEIGPFQALFYQSVRST